jgi:hypothetical protein
MTRALLARLSLIAAALALLLAGSASAQSLAPAATTGAADGIDPDVATLHGSVNPQGLDTQFWFEYGRTASLGARTSARDAGSGLTAVDVQQQIGSLRDGTTYRYRIVARNSLGTTEGAIRTFKTKSKPKPKPAPDPVAVTDKPSQIAQTTVQFNGRLNNRGAAATYHFEYGPTTAYGASTPVTAIGAGTATQTVSAAANMLQPATTYHVRLVLQIGARVVRGSDRRFTTAKIPNGLLIQANRTTTWMGSTIDVFGVLAGTGNAATAISVQADPYPYGDGWVDVANGRTDATGAYRIPVSPLLLNTHLRAVAATSPAVTSPAITVSVRVRSSLHVSKRRVRRSQKVRFWGSVEPAQPGASVSIQRRVGHHWRTIASTRQRGSGERSSYTRRVRLYSSGKYRTLARANDGAHASHTSSGRFIRVRR